MLEDPSRAMTINQVTHPDNVTNLYPEPTDENGFDYSIKAYWKRYRLLNNTALKIGIALPKNVTQTDIFTRERNGQWHRKTTGTERQADEHISIMYL